VLRDSKLHGFCSVLGPICDIDVLQVALGVQLKEILGQNDFFVVELSDVHEHLFSPKFVDGINDPIFLGDFLRILDIIAFSELYYGLI